MASVAIIETKPSRNDFYQSFNQAFEFDRFYLCSDPTIKKVLKKNVDIDFDPDNYEWVILVGADACKYYTKNASVTDYSGKIVEEKFLPVINPAMITFKPESARLWEESRDSIIGYISGTKKVVTYSTDRIYGITDSDHLKDFLRAAIASPNSFIGLDSETTALYPRNGYILGVSLCYERDHGAYISSDCIDDEASELFQELFNKKTVVFHNAKFDLPFMKFHFGWNFPVYEDTMLLHYCIDENPGTHGLKQLALQYTDYGDYEQPMYDWIDEYRKKTGCLKDDFSFEFIPFDIIKTYAAIDAVVTFLLYAKIKPAVTKNKKLDKVYKDILIPASTFLIKVQDNGVPFDMERLKFAQKEMQKSIDESIEELYKEPKVREFEEAQGKPFNPNSVMQLRSFLFDYLGLQPTGKKTSTDANSTDAEVLKELSEQHHVPKLILNIRQKSKIKNTYLDKIIPQLDRDQRLRTNFNIHGTTSGRLSSSGKLNLQQLPRDNSAVKGSIKATPGHKIVSVDLTTAEVYVAAVLSNDKELMGVFKSGGDFHSTIAKKVFNLECSVKEVKELHPLLRQAAKAITFGIMYGAGPSKISWQVTKDAKENGLDYVFTEDDAKEAISAYFKQFKGLKNWITKNQDFIAQNGYIYSFFGRKRRLPNVLSTDRAVKGHAVRSGLNFLVQSPASDVNLLAGIDMQSYIDRWGMKARIFALVHDSILAEVPDDEVDHYIEKLTGFIKTDRGLSIPGSAIGCDFDVGEDYSFGKFEEQYATMQ
jgi:DNA polymerase I-like protein with 3'-5' exonuclease and polymerase domains